jgi:integrase
MKVTIRGWKLKKGECLYLDIYHRGLRIRENLNIVLDGNKQYDAEKLRIAEILRARREVELLSDHHGIVTEHRGRITLVDYAQRVGSASIGRNLKLLTEHFGNLELSSVTTKHLSDYQTRMLQVPLAPSTVETYINALVAVFNRAVQDHLIRESPAKALKRVHAVEKPPQSLTDLELQRLEETPIMGQSGFGGEIKRAFLFACMTGLRISDLQALTWGKIRVSSHGKQVEATQIKTGASVYVPLNKRAWTIIDPGVREIDSAQKVFPLLATKTDPNQYTAKWGLTAGVGKIHFHQSRHTFPRFLLEQGVDLVTVQNLMGHTKIETTARYGKASSQQKADAVQRLDRTTAP